MPDPSFTYVSPGAGRLAAEPAPREETLQISGMPANESESPDAYNAVVEISGDGKILNVLNWTTADASPQADSVIGQKLDAVWPSEISLPIIDNAHRVIRSKQVRCLKLDSADGSTCFEAILVVQGRDRVLVVLRDVSAIAGKVSRLERLAYLDKVTGLPNEEWLMAELAALTERLQIHGGRAALICIDITNLRVAERAYFELSRVAVLEEIAQRLLVVLRGANDDVEVDSERYSAVARIDAQRFAVVVPRIETGGDAALIAERLTEMLEQPIEIREKSFELRVACGMALYPQDGRSAADLFENANVALAEAIFSQTSSQKFHSGTVRMRALEREDLESELKSALEKEEFSLTYLPIVASDSRQVVCAEALLRWPARSFGGQPVSEIINVAEYTGVIVPLGEWVFQHAFTQLREWHEAGHQPLGIAVNVSPQEFARGNLVARTERFLQETGLAASNVAIEISEQILFRDASNGYALCNGLKALGVGISVDNFGKGICSIECLANSPIDTVKIHMDLVAQVNSSATGRSACAAIVACAHELGLRVIAEGVDSEECAAGMQELGCDSLQGFLFSLPLESDRFAEYLAANGAAPQDRRVPS